MPGPAWGLPHKVIQLASCRAELGKLSTGLGHLDPVGPTDLGGAAAGTRDQAAAQPAAAGRGPAVQQLLPLCAGPTGAPRSVVLHCSLASWVCRCSLLVLQGGVLSVYAGAQRKGNQSRQHEQQEQQQPEQQPEQQHQPRQPLQQQQQGLDLLEGTKRLHAEHMEDAAALKAAAHARQSKVRPCWPAGLHGGVHLGRAGAGRRLLLAAAPCLACLPAGPACTQLLPCGSCTGWRRVLGQPSRCLARFADRRAVTDGGCAAVCCSARLPL